MKRLRLSFCLLVLAGLCLGVAGCATTAENETQLSTGPTSDSDTHEDVSHGWGASLK